MNMQVISSAGVGSSNGTMISKPFSLEELQKLGLYETEIDRFFDKHEMTAGPKGSNELVTITEYTFKPPVEVNGKQIYSVKQLVAELNSIRPPKDYSAENPDTPTVIDTGHGSGVTNGHSDGERKMDALDALALRNTGLVGGKAGNARVAHDIVDNGVRPHHADPNGGTDRPYKPEEDA